MYWRKIPWFVQRIFPNVIWRIPNSDNKIYLTFDDGPCPDVTIEILKILDHKKIKASFFCLGENIERHPILFDEIESKGHFVGNHGWQHKDGWKINHEDFLQNILTAQKYYSNNFYRPPFGKLKWKYLIQPSKDFKVVMWDILSGDFDTKLDRNSCLKFIMKKAQSGSIIVFHDNLKSSQKMLSILPEMIDGLKEKSFRFERF